MGFIPNHRGPQGLFFTKMLSTFLELVFVKEKLLKTYIWRTKLKLTYFGGLVGQIRVWFWKSVHSWPKIHVWCKLSHNRFSSLDEDARAVHKHFLNTKNHLYGFMRPNKRYCKQKLKINSFTITILYFLYYNLCRPICEEVKGKYL